MNQRVKLQMVKHYQVIESGLERERGSIRGNIISLQLFLIIHVNMWLEMRMSG